MNYSQGRFSAFFSSGLKIVKANGHYRIYTRRVNQNHTYYLMSHGKILHVGKRKHILAMWRRYFPVSVDSYLHA